MSYFILFSLFFHFSTICSAIVLSFWDWGFFPMQKYKNLVKAEPKSWQYWSIRYWGFFAACFSKCMMKANDFFAVYLYLGKLSLTNCLKIAFFCSVDTSCIRPSSLKFYFFFGAILDLSWGYFLGCGFFLALIYISRLSIFYFICFICSFWSFYFLRRRDIWFWSFSFFDFSAWMSW